MTKLSQRQHTILDRIVETHIETAHPVGSKAVTQRYGIQYSPATVRNEMGILEDMGYLTHAHTSSGRFPTDQGYRYYVDHCLDDSEDSDSDAQFPDLEGDLYDLCEHVEEPDSVAETASKVLASMAREVGLISLIWPGFLEFRQVPRFKVYLQGSAHILDKPEFQDVAKVRAIFHAFEEKEKLTRWIHSQVSDKGVSIRIGGENEPEVLRDCAVVSARYSNDKDHVITIAVLGPKRMPYARTIPLVHFMVKTVGQIFNEKWSA